MVDDKTFEKPVEVKDIAFKTLKPCEMGHDLLKTVGKTSRINGELGDFDFQVHIWWLFLYKRGEDKQPNDPMKMEGWTNRPRRAIPSMAIGRTPPRLAARCG